MEDIYRNGNYRRKSSHRSKHSAKTVSYRPQYNSNNRNNKNRKRRKKAKRMEEPKLNKKKVFMVIAIPILIIMFINNKKGKNIEVSGKGTDIKESQSTTETNNINMPTQTTNTSTNSTQTTNKVEITDWKLRLANYDNLLPEDFEVELANIDNSKDPKQFDARAVKYLKDMINAMKKAGNTSIWCQSTYRSVKRQKELYDASVQKYLKQGKTQEEADKLTLEYINKPGGSDHNLGLAVDFNYVDNSFAKTSEYKWLLKNAENYGFILRYPEDKEDKTKIAYDLEKMANNKTLKGLFIKKMLDKLENKEWYNDNLLSLAGVYQPAKKIDESKIPLALNYYLNQNQSIKKIYLHFDNDSAGRIATMALKTVLPKQYEVIDDPPKIGKDFNDFLCAKVGINYKKRYEKER